MPKKKGIAAYSFADSLAMLNKLQKMAIDEGNINLALKAEELKCKIASMQADEKHNSNDNLTKILVDFINDKQNHCENSADICAIDSDKEEI